MTANDRLHVVIFMPSFGDGGVERMLVNMAGGLAARGLAIDFWVGTAGGPFLERLPPEVRLLRCPSRRAAVRFLAFVRYLRESRPQVVLTAKDRALRTALRARRWSAVPCCVVARPGTTVSERLAKRSALKRWRTLWLLRGSYRRADLIVANSAGVARDVASITGVPEGRIPVVRNPVITADLEQLAAAPATHPWIAPGAPPLILGVGGLRRQKDFDTLLRAFALVRSRRDCRLLVLGSGRLEADLRQLARDLGIEERVDLPGFVENPYPFLRAAAVFALSSRWEGSPNVLTEALALGTPVVSTDCPSGPREILDGGRLGPLVPVGDAEALAAAILRTLESPPDRQALREAVREYTVAENARRYEALLRALPRIGTA